MKKLGAVLQTTWFQVILMFATFLALYLPDMNVALKSDPANDIIMAWICVVITVVFTAEIVIQLLVPDPYFLTFYFS